MECPFDLTNNRQVIDFDEVDPYNPQNRLKGYINRRQGHLYGTLYITHVNDKECPQIIYSAPKQHYPFNTKDEWKFPEFDEVLVYDKLDGTCIISYTYHDDNGMTYLTYKTRLRPFLGHGEYGNFFSLWNEMRDKYPIDKLCMNLYFNFVFELYGKRNKVLIDYDVPLDTRLLFLIGTNNDLIYPPDGLAFVNDSNVPVVNGHKEDFTDLKTDYLHLQQQLEDELLIDEDNQLMKGREGVVMYFVKDGAVQLKCKPPSVLKYHWAGDAIPYPSVYTTVYNAFENFDEPTTADVIELLKEEYDIGLIEKSKKRIERALGKILFDKKFQYQLADDYRKHNFDINKDKVTCMRWFGQHCPRSQAKKIFNLLKQYEDK